MKRDKRRRHAIRLKLSLVVFLAVAVVMTTKPAFTFPQVLSVTQPVGWAAVSKDMAGQLTSAIQEHFRNLGNVDLDKVAVVIFNLAESRVDLNVGVMTGRISIDGSRAEQKLAGTLRDQFGKMGLALGTISTTRSCFGIYAALVADDESNPARPSRLSYIVTGAIIGGLYGLFKTFKKKE